jgi:hypothetical protein
MATERQQETHLPGQAFVVLEAGFGCRQRFEQPPFDGPALNIGSVGASKADRSRHLRLPDLRGSQRQK